MYVVAKHEILDPAAAFPRGERLQKGEGAPAGVRALQFYPSADGSQVVCLWEADSADAVQRYVDETLAGSSVNTCYQVDADQAFSERPLGMATTPLALRAG